MSPGDDILAAEHVGTPIASLRPLPCPRSLERRMRMWLAGKLYVVDGNDAANGYTNTVYVYDPSTNAWSSTATMPTGRASLGSGVVKNVFYGVGGQSASSAAVTSNEALTP